MKSKMKWFVGLIFLSLFWNACTVQKCVYRRGFNVEFKGFYSAKKPDETAVKQNHVSNEYPAVASVEGTEVLEALTIQKPALVSERIDSFDTPIKEWAVVKPLKGFCKTKDAFVVVSNNFETQTKVLSQENAAPLAPDWLILLLCLAVPPLAVALMTNSNSEKILIALLLWILGVVPGIVYAFLVFLHLL